MDVKSLDGELEGIKRTAPGKWQGTVSPHWQVGKIPCGGYVTALALHTLTGELFAGILTK